MAQSEFARVIDRARERLARCASWRTWTGCTSDRAARAYTHAFAVPGTATYPYCAIDFASHDSERIAEVGYRLNGEVDFFIEHLVVEATSIAWCETNSPEWDHDVANLAALDALVDVTNGALGHAQDTDISYVYATSGDTWTETTVMKWEDNPYGAVFTHFCSLIGDIEAELKASPPATGFYASSPYQVYRNVRTIFMERRDESEVKGGKDDTICAVIRCNLEL